MGKHKFVKLHDMVDNDVDLDYSDMDFTKGLNSKLQLVSYPILQPLFNLIQEQKVIYDIRKIFHFEHWISKSLINKILSLNNQNDTLIAKIRPSNLKIKPYQVLTDNSHFFFFNI